MAVTEKTDDAAVLLASKLNTLHTAFELLEVQVSEFQAQLDLLKSLNVFPIIGEENGNLSNNAFEWSHGNGSTGNDIGVVVPFDCELIFATFNADIFGTSVSIHIRRNNVGVTTPLFTSNNSTVVIPPILFAKDSLVSYQTAVVTGSNTDARITAWMRPV